MKAIVGIGDSWTQGVGGVPLHFFQQWGGRVDRLDPYSEDILYPHELENSWVNILSKKLGYVPFNLGMRGYGNRGAVKNLYYCDIPWNDITEGWVIFLLSGRSRWDLTSRVAEHGRRRMFTLYPHNIKVPEYQFYLKYLHSAHVDTQETLMNICEARMFAKAHNMKFLFGYAFDNCHDMIINDAYSLSTQIDWGKECLTPNYTYFDRLSALDNMTASYGDYSVLTWPKMYVTNCVHPTIEGYKVIADHIYNIL